MRQYEGTRHLPLPCLAATLLLALAACGGASAVAPASGGGPSSASAPAASVAPVRFATNGQVPSSAWVWLMGDSGVFAKNGLNVQLQAMTGQASTNAMVGGD